MINKTGLADYKPWICPVGVRISDTQTRKTPLPRDLAAEYDKEKQKKIAATANTSDLKARTDTIKRMLKEGYRASVIQKTTKCSYITIKRYREMIEKGVEV